MKHKTAEKLTENKIQESNTKIRKKNQKNKTK